MRPSSHFMASSWHFLLFVSCSFLAYANALNMDFIADDIGRILLQQDTFEHGLFYTLPRVLPDRPFLMTTIWLNYRLGGIDPQGFKIVNIALHGCVGFALWHLVTMIFGGHRSMATILTVLLFVVHPLQNQSINSIIQRGTLLSTLGVLVSLLFFMRYTQSSATHYYLLSLGAFLVGLLSKQSAIALPLVLIGYLIILQRRTLRDSLRLTFPFVALLAVPLVFYFGLDIDRQTFALPWYEYLSIQTRVIFLYFKLFFLPFGLHFTYFIDQNPGFFDSFTWLAATGHLAIWGLIYVAWLKGERPLCFCATAMYVCFLPESGIFPIFDLAFPHRTYLPFTFLFPILFWAVTTLSNRQWNRAGISIALIGILLLTAENLSYNHRINTYEKWALYNVNASEDHTDLRFNVAALNHLFSRDEIATGNRILSLLRHKFPSEEHYTLYRQVYEYKESDPSVQEQVRHNLTVALTDRERSLYPPARLFLNVFLVRILSERYPPVEGSLRVDDLLFSQLPILRASPAFYGPRIFPRYAFHLDRLAGYYESQGLESLDHYHTLRYLRALAVLELYYQDRMPEKDVQRDVELNFRRAFQQFPESPDLIKGYRWYRSHKSGSPTAPDTISRCRATPHRILHTEDVSPSTVLTGTSRVFSAHMLI